MQPLPKTLIIVLAAILLAGGGFWFYKKNQPVQTEQVIYQEQVQGENATTISATTTAGASAVSSKTVGAQTIPNWKTYRSDRYKASFQYPSSWVVKESYLNIDGNVLVTSLRGWSTDVTGKIKLNTIDEMVSQEIIVRNFENFGKNPSMTKTIAAGQEARLVVSPKGEGAVRAGLIVKYPKPIRIDNVDYYYFMLKFSRSDYTTEIKNTIKFLL